MSSQKEINSVWSKVWTSQIPHDVSAIFSNRYFLESYPHFRKYIPHDVGTILDVGAGTGRYGLQLARDFPQSEVTLSDIVEESVLLMDKTREALGLHNVVVRREDVYHLSFPDNSFDVVLCCAVIMHVTQPLQMLRECVRVLRPGGVIILSSVNSWNVPYMTEKHVLDLFKKPAYGYEKEFSQLSLRRLLRQEGLRFIEGDGYYFAYGIDRWKRRGFYAFFRFLSTWVHRMTRVFDLISGHAFSRYFGFEVFVVGKKEL